MPNYRFAGYRFDTRCLTLSRDGRPVPLRPKTACVLKLLLDERAHIVSKRELATAVWQSVHVTDQSLFQAISELRKTLAPLTAIKTHPNLGYQWIAPARQRSSPLRFALAAALALAVAAGWTLRTSPLASPESGAAQELVISPALHALATGLAELTDNQPDSARDRGFVCATAEIEGRIVVMMTPVPARDATATSPAPMPMPMPMPQDALTASATDVAAEFPDYCQQIRPPLPDPDARERAGPAFQPVDRLVCLGQKEPENSLV